VQNVEIVNKSKVMPLWSRQNEELYECRIFRPVETIRKYGGSRRRMASKDEDADSRAQNFLTVRIYSHIFGRDGNGFCRESATEGNGCFGVRMMGERKVAVLMYMRHQGGT